MTRLEALKDLLNQIAISADTLANFAAIHTEGLDDRGACMFAMHAVQAMAERIGAISCLADPKSFASVAQHLVGYEMAQALLGGDHVEPCERASGDLQASMAVATDDSRDKVRELRPSNRSPDAGADVKGGAA